MFFYRAKIGPVRVVLCKLTVNLAINVAMGSFWSACLFGKGYYYYLAKSVVKNLLLLPLEAVLLFAFFAAMIPILERMNVIPKGQLRLRNKKQPPAKDSVPQM